MSKHPQEHIVLPLINMLMPHLSAISIWEVSNVSAALSCNWGVHYVGMNVSKLWVSLQRGGIHSESLYTNWEHVVYIETAWCKLRPCHLNQDDLFQIEMAWYKGWATCRWNDETLQCEFLYSIYYLMVLCRSKPSKIVKWIYNRMWMGGGVTYFTHRKELTVWKGPGVGWGAESGVLASYSWKW